MRNDVRMVIRKGRKGDFEPPSAHPCLALGIRGRRRFFVDVAGEVWARICREKTDAAAEQADDLDNSLDREGVTPDNRS